MAVYVMDRSHTKFGKLINKDVEELASVCIHYAAIVAAPLKASMIGVLILSETETAWKRPNPLKRFTEPKELSDAIGYLVPPASIFVNREALVVDGGYLSAGIKTAEQHSSNIGRSL